MLIFSARSVIIFFMVNVVIDAMGGDHAPEEIIKGAVLAVQKCQDVSVSLVGKAEAIEPILKKVSSGTEQARIKIIPASEVIENEDHPVEAVRKKKDSSMIVGMKLVRDGEADAFVSAGNSGAVMVGAQAIIGRQENVSRAPFAHVVPLAKGTSFLLDCGANVDVRPEHLVSFAYLAKDYLERTAGIKNPTIGLINIGKEETKGNALTQEAYQLLKQAEDLNFIGNVEPTGVTKGEADIYVCDGFTGNVIVKMYEGLGNTLLGVIKDSFTVNMRTKLGALMVKTSLKEKLKPFDVHTYGGAPILGLKGPVVKVHGNAEAISFYHAIMQCVDYLSIKGE